ncbi:MAG: hypothetical protein EXS05_15550 [Planctomycetaceae bacterium]|nr:hypothetical protein [Planctomycetaceae bacterium]
MPARFLLIDGYNLLHAAGMARSDYGPGDLQRCRERLLRYLSGKLSAAEMARTTVIFDARDPPPDRPARQVVRGLTVLFANPGGDADVVIEQWLDDHSAPKQVTLVSSDHVLQRAARRNRALFVDSEVFFERLERRRDRSDEGHTGRGQTPDAKPADGLTAAETAQWMKFFGDLSALAAGIGIDGPDDAGAETDVPPAAEPPSAAAGAGDPTRRTRRAARKKGQSEKGQSRNSKRPANVSADDLAHWLEVFGGLPEAQELGRGKSISQADLERWLAEFDRSDD